MSVLSFVGKLVDLWPGHARTAFQSPFSRLSVAFQSPFSRPLRGYNTNMSTAVVGREMLGHIEVFFNEVCSILALEGTLGSAGFLSDL